MVNTGTTTRIVAAFVFCCMLGAGWRAAAEEAPRAPQNLGKAEDVVVPGPGANLIRNGSFEGSTKYACQAGEWRKKRGREAVDGTTAAVGRYSMAKEVYVTGEWRGKPTYDGGFQFAPFHCKWDRLYCVSFYARTDIPGAKLNASVRGMHHSDNEKWGKYPELEGEHVLTAEWKRYHFFFPANRIQKGGSAANSYYVSIGCRPQGENDVGRFWVDGLQVEEVEGFEPAAVAKMQKRTDIPRSVVNYPTPFKLYAPVEVCTESINLPKHNLYTPEQNVARIRAAIVNGDEARSVTAQLKLLDHRQRELWSSPKTTKSLQPGENWLPELDVTLPRKGAMLVRTLVTDATGATLNFSDEPVTVLPFDLSDIGSHFDERFGMNLSFARDPNIADEDNLALGMFRRLGFRWVRNAHHNDESVGFAERNGLNQFVSIFDYPKPVRQGRFPHTLPKDQQWDLNDDAKWDDLSVETAFDKELREIANRYKGKVEAYQFGNETTAHDVKDPRIPWRVCRRAARVIRSVDPDVKIIGASIIYDWKISWWDKVMELGGLEDMDYFGWDWDCYVLGGSKYDMIMKMREIMRQKSGGKEVPPFNYETGWGSGWMQDYPADPIGGSRLDYGVIPAGMAKCFARIFAAGSRHFILHLAGYQENFMGSYWSCTRWPTQVYDEQERPRVTLAAYNVAVKFLGLCEPYGRQLRIDHDLEAYAFTEQRENRPLLVYWSTAKEQTGDTVEMAIDLPALTAYDVMGNELPVARAGAGKWRLPLPLHQDPVYLLGPAGASPKVLLDALTALPQIPLHIPAEGEGNAPGVDSAGGRWEFLYATQESLKKGALEIVPPEKKGSHVWGGLKDSGRRAEVGGHGRANNNADYGYAACLTFEPPAPGRYLISGDAVVVGGNGNRMRIIAGILAADGSLRVLGSQESENGDVDLATLLPGRAVVLQAGEKLLVTGWRTQWHWHGTLQLQDLRLRAAE